MNFMDLMKKAFSNSWTGGASIDPRTGKLGDPNRFHGPGTFDDFKMADLFNNDRWAREKIGDPNPKSDRQQYTSYYIPKTERREEDVTDTTKIVDGVETRTFTKKYKTGGRSGEGSSSYDPVARELELGQQNLMGSDFFKMGEDSPEAWAMGGANPSMNANYGGSGDAWKDEYTPWEKEFGTSHPNATPIPGELELGQANLRRNPGYPGQQGLPSISRAQQYMPSQYSMRNPGYPSMNANYALQRSGQENLNNFHPVRRGPGYPGQQSIPSPLYPPRQSFEGSNPYQPNLGRNPFNDATLYPIRNPDISSDRNPFDNSSLTAGITPEMKKIMIDMMRQRSFKRGSY